MHVALRDSHPPHAICRSRSGGPHSSLFAASSNFAISFDAIASTAHAHGSHHARFTSTQSVACVQSFANAARSTTGAGAGGGGVSGFATGGCGGGSAFGAGSCFV